MALTRKSLKAMGIDEEKIEQIIEMHSETVEGLTGDMKRYKEDAEKLPSVQKKVAELEELSAQHAKDPYKVKYEGVKEEFDAYKKTVEGSKAMETKRAAYKKLLADCSISDKRHDATMKIADFDAIKIV